MIGFLKKLFSSAQPTDYAALIKDGAAIVDVRSKGEFAGGHIKGSINIPLDVLKAQMSKLNKEHPLLFVAHPV
jgi:phage shock protein E